MCDDLDRFLQQLNSAILELPSSAPAGCAGEARLHYLQFFTDARELLDRGERLRQHLAANMPPPAAIDLRSPSHPLPTT